MPIENVYPGIKTWRVKDSNYRVLQLHYQADPEKWVGERIHVAEINKDLSPWALGEYNKLTDKSLYLQEYEIDSNARQGARLFNFDDAATLVNSKDVGPILHEWTRWHGLDPHPRVPHAHLWCAVDPYGDRWYYREFWPSKLCGQPGNIPEDDNRYKIKEYCEVVHYLESGDNPENGGKPELIYRRVIDYAARAFGKGMVDDGPQLNIQQRYEQISREVGAAAGDNWRMTFVDCVKDRDAGIELVNDGLRPFQVEVDGEWKKRSRIHILADKCPELVLQLRTNRYPKLTAVQADSRDPIATPLQKRNHCIAQGSLVATDNGPVAIEAIRTGMKVWTRHGLQQVTAAAMTMPRAHVMAVYLSNGNILRGTAEHTVLVRNDWVTIDSLRYGDILTSCAALPSSSTATPIGATPVRFDGQTAFISDTHNGRSTAISTATFGERTTARFRKAVSYIIGTAIRSTMTLPTSNANRSASTHRIMAVSGNVTPQSWTRSVLWQVFGIVRKLAGTGTASKWQRCGRASERLSESVRSAGGRIHLATSRNAAFAATNVGQQPAINLESTTNRERASYAEQHSLLTATPASAPATDNAVRVVGLCQDGTAPVYDLAVANAHEFYVNGVLVHNCTDLIRYVEMDKPRFIPRNANIESDWEPLSDGVNY